MAKLSEIHTFGTHFRPHPDEGVAYWIFRSFKEDESSNTGKLKLMFTDSGPHTPDGRSAEEWENEGVLWVGCGGGRCDEHPNPTIRASRKEKKCSALLFVEMLEDEIGDEIGAEEFELFKKAISVILSYTTKIDLEGGPQPFDIYSIMNAMHAIRDPEYVLNWFADALDVVIEMTQDVYKARELIQIMRTELEKLDFSENHVRSCDKMFSDARYFEISTILSKMIELKGLEFTQKWFNDALDTKKTEQQAFIDAGADVANIKLIKIPVGKRNGKMEEYLVAFGESDNSRFNARVRYEHRKVAIIIQRNRAGNVTIFSNKDEKINAELKDIPRVIRAVEMLKDGKTPNLSAYDLSREGEIPEVPNWFYHASLRAMFNGSLTSPNKTPTRLTMDEIINCVRIGLDPNLFYEKFAGSCAKNVCSGNKCLWYSFQLSRCNMIRILAQYQKRPG